jgi:Fe-S-cluster-containing hydrogenase component 2
MVRMLGKPEVCHACRICELMCSYHHCRIFSPERSSIHVISNESTGTISWSVDPTCDRCEREEETFCLKYCPYGSLEGLIS